MYFFLTDTKEQMVCIFEIYVKTYFLYVFVCVCLHACAEVRDNLWELVLSTVGFRGQTQS